MSGKAFEKNLDLLVEDAEERAKAAKQLRDIALRHPDLLRQAVELLDAKTETTEPPKVPTRRIRQTPTAAVRQWLREHKEGGTAGDIVKGVIGRVRSESKDPTSVLYATVSVLKRQGELEVVERPGQSAIYRLAHDRAMQNGTAH
ncbi:MAG: hypothetical protein L0228_05270 [Planctomycetes bacterium]|nr:hypothetical protein [Planctomycetota bacterium]